MTRKNRTAERFHAILYGGFLFKYVQTFQFSLNSINDSGNIHYNIHAFLIACPAQLVEDLLERRMFKAEGAERNESFCAEYAALFNAIITVF